MPQNSALAALSVWLRSEFQQVSAPIVTLRATNNAQRGVTRCDVAGSALTVRRLRRPARLAGRLCIAHGE